MPRLFTSLTIDYGCILISASYGGDMEGLSKTDRDATFMKMKEDHMKNGLAKSFDDLAKQTRIPKIRLLDEAIKE